MAGLGFGFDSASFLSAILAVAGLTLSLASSFAACFVSSLPEEAETVDGALKTLGFTIEDFLESIEDSSLDSSSKDVSAVDLSLVTDCDFEIGRAHV